MLSTTVRLFVVSARIAAVAGAALTSFAMVSWVIDWVSAPYWDWNVGALPVILPAQFVLAGWLAWTAVKREWAVLLRRAALVFVGAFVLLYGWYFLLLWGEGGMLIASGNLAYGASALLAGCAYLLSVAGGGSDRGRAPTDNPDAAGDEAYR